MLPAEPEILIARLAFPDAQPILNGATRPDSRTVNFVTCGWYGTQISDERGSFAVVSTEGEHSHLAGEIVRVIYGNKTVCAYVAETAGVDFDICLTRRLFAALAHPALLSVPVLYEVIESDATR